MKKFILSTAMVATSILCQFANAGAKLDADAANEIKYAKIFETVNKKATYDLGPQCAYKNRKDITALNIENSSDEDLAMSYDDFLKKVKENGLLDKAFFDDAKRPDADMQNSIDSILSASDEIEKKGLVDNPKRCFLNKKEFFALFYYTGEGYRMLNQALRTNDIKKLEALRVIGKHIYTALDKITPYKGYVKRGQNMFKDAADIKKFETEYKVGAMVTMPAYTSTSVGKQFDGDIQYVIKVKKNCTYIADFSLVETKDLGGWSQMEEEEVLCQNNTKFKVLYHGKDAQNKHKLVLEEVE